MLTIGKLRGLLGEGGDLHELADETEVRLVHQPHYPLQCMVSDEVIVVGCDDERIEELEKALSDARDLLDSGSGIDLSQLGDEARYEYEMQAGELDDLRATGNQTSVVYLAEGDQVYAEPYGPAIVTKQLGWR